MTQKSVTFASVPRHQHICPHCGKTYVCVWCPTPGVYALAHPACANAANQRERMREWKMVKKLGPVEIGLRNGRSPIVSIRNHETPIKSLLNWKADVRRLIGELPRENARWPDGTLRGVKGFVIDAPMKFQALSPVPAILSGLVVKKFEPVELKQAPRRLYTAVQNTLMDDSSLTAHQWNSGDMLRGVAGIHACWPARNWIRGKSACAVGPRNHEIHASWTVAEVAGHGLCVTGELGWRAQHITLINLWLPKAEKEVGMHYMMKGVNIIWI